METGWNISQVFLSASRFFNLLFFVARVLVRITLQIFFCLHCNHPLTKFFVLSNIRFVSGGSSEMLRTSRCFRINFLQSAGPRMLSAFVLSPCNLFELSGNLSAFWRTATRDQSSFCFDLVGVGGHS